MREWLTKTGDGALKKLFGFVTEHAGAIIASILLLLGYIALGVTLYNVITNVPINGNLEAIGTVELHERAEN